MAVSDSFDDPSGGLVAKAAPGDNAEPLSVSALSALLKRTVEDRFGFVRLRGELSGVKRAASGHLYCSLKDENARIDGVMWRGGAQRLPFMPEDGLEVIATGKLTTYPGRSSYQIVIERMEIAGEGALLALLEKTKARLEAEGLFAPQRKRPGGLEAARGRGCGGRRRAGRAPAAQAGGKGTENHAADVGQRGPCRRAVPARLQGLARTRLLVVAHRSGRAAGGVERVG